MELTEKNITEKMRGHQAERIFLAPQRNSAVLIPLIRTENGLEVVYEKRKGSIDHGGEFSFPGGRIEPGESQEEAAVRETMEELQIEKEQIRLICPMHDIMGPGGADIRSFLGVLEDYQGTFSPDEVDRILNVPLKWLMETEPERYDADMLIRPHEDFPYDLVIGGKNYYWMKIPRRFYFYRTENAQKDVIWGLTGNLTYQAVQLLKERL